MQDTKQLYHGYRFHPAIISYAAWLYDRFSLSFYDVEDLLAERRFVVSYESIRQCCNRFGPEFVRRLKKRKSRLGDTWHLDEVFIKIRGQQHYLWRVIGQDGDAIDILAQKHRNKAVAKRFFCKLLKDQNEVPWRKITDKLKSNSAAHRKVLPSVPRSTEQYDNNRAEVSHELTRKREPQMRRFKSTGQAQRFVTVYGVIGNLFRLGWHLMRAVHCREFRSKAFCQWQ